MLFSERRFLFRRFPVRGMFGRRRGHSSSFHMPFELVHPPFLHCLKIRGVAHVVEMLFPAVVQGTRCRIAHFRIGVRSWRAVVPGIDISSACADIPWCTGSTKGGTKKEHSKAECREKEGLYMRPCVTGRKLSGHNCLGPSWWKSLKKAAKSKEKPASHPAAEPVHCQKAKTSLQVTQATTRNKAGQELPKTGIRQEHTGHNVPEG